jgi:hypothetical protein
MYLVGWIMILIYCKIDRQKKFGPFGIFFSSVKKTISQTFHQDRVRLVLFFFFFFLIT